MYEGFFRRFYVTLRRCFDAKTIFLQSDVNFRFRFYSRQHLFPNKSNSTFSTNSHSLISMPLLLASCFHITTKILVLVDFCAQVLSKVRWLHYEEFWNPSVNSPKFLNSSGANMYAKNAKYCMQK